MKLLRYTQKMSIKAFTIIELLAVIAVIGILAAILIAAIGSIRENAKISQSTSNLRQMGTYVNLYSMENAGELPIHTFGNPRNWINALWELAYPDTTLDFTPDSQGRVLPNSIFYSPLMETDRVRAGETIRSYGWNMHVRVHFQGADSWPRQSNVLYPGRTILAGDSTSSSAIGATNNQVNFRNNGQAAFLFADGHVELRGPDEVPNNSNHVFWGGSILVEASE